MKAMEIIREKISEMLKNGEIPWHKPWICTNKAAHNYVTGHRYSLLNQLLLGKPGGYASYKQWESIGAKVKAGEKGSKIFFWKLLKKDEEIDGEPTGKEKIIPYLKWSVVFHECQVEGLEPVLDFNEEPRFEPIDEAENLVNDYCTRNGISLIKEEQDRAYYSRKRDMIKIPLLKQFNNSSIAEYYSTVFHECIHSTGHETRLNRLTDARFGSEEYAKEELVAEIGSACLLYNTGIGTPESLKNNAAYIQEWSSILTKTPNLLIKAAGLAEKAVSFFMSEETMQEIEEEMEAS